MKKYSEFRICRVCGQRVKIWNLERHFQKVHPREINELKSVVPQIGKCIVCGVDTDNERQRFVCEKHRVQILPKFLIGEVLLPLRDRVNSILTKARNECVEYFMQMFLMEMYASLSAISKDGKKESFSFSLEEITHDQLASLSDKALFLGYALPRISEAFPLIGERAYELASRNEGISHARTRYDSDFLEALLSEFEFFYASYFGLQEFFEVATDSEQKPQKIFIIPNSSRISVLKMLMLRLKDAEFIYRVSLYPVIHPSTEECVYDRNGAFFCYSRKNFENHFETFKRIWAKYFGSQLAINIEEYMDFRDYFKWIVCPIGFTRENKKKAKYLEEFKTFDEETLFSLIDCILPDISLAPQLASSRALGSKDPTYELLDQIFKLGFGFRFSSSKGVAYFLPVIEWLNNLLKPVHSQFGRTLDLVGTFYEEWTGRILAAFSKRRLGFKFTNEFGYVPIMKKKVKGEVLTQWRLLEKNKRIQILDNKDKETVVAEGEIDLIVFANYSLYLLELKSVNLDNKKALKYLNTKAPEQCRKYSDWAKEDGNIESLLVKHGIEKDQLNSVRVICCTNGVYDKTTITDSKTKEVFSVLPTFLLLNLFAGVFTMSIRDIIPSFMSHIKNGLVMALPSLRETCLVDNSKALSEIANQIIQEWHSLMIFDRRQSFSNFKTPKPQGPMLSRFYIGREFFIENTCSWLLKKPKLIGQVEDFSYYLGTQIGIAGTTLVCLNCRSAVKYYIPAEEKIQDQVMGILETGKCCFCGKRTSTVSENPKQKMTMALLVAEAKRNADSELLET